jgi:hypothetical protein
MAPNGADKKDSVSEFFPVRVVRVPAGRDSQIRKQGLTTKTNSVAIMANKRRASGKLGVGPLHAWSNRLIGLPAKRAGALRSIS